MSLGSSLPPSKMSDNELRRLGVDELVRQLRKCDQDRLQYMMDHSTLMKDLNRRMQVHLMEIRSLKDVNTRLQEDNQELRDLCCFLDDDRSKGRKLAREWQKFGHYSSSVMRSEVTVYQDKLKELEAKQAGLMKENVDLKELCIFLDQENAGSTSNPHPSIDDRDRGDGSSSSSPTNEKFFLTAPNHNDPMRFTPIDLPSSTNRIPAPTEPEAAAKQTTHRNLINEQTLHYIRQLEKRISDLEREKWQPADKLPNEDRQEFRKFFSTPQINRVSAHPIQRPENLPRNMSPLRPAASSSRQRGESPTPSPPQPIKPGAVVHAMKVLEIHEQLEKPSMVSSQPGEDEIDETEQAIVREMCKSVWRKLGDAVPGYKTAV